MEVVFAQQDTVLLDAVTISATQFTKYSSGAKVVKLSSEDSLGNLNDMMAQLPSITFKNYGNYGLSSISFRGTSASHTQLNWNGIPVNSPTLGQADFSLSSGYLIDEISVQYGSTSALTGSGAIGGAVSMDYISPNFKKQFAVNIALKSASFGHYFEGVKLAYGNNWLAAKTKVYHRSIVNNFSFPQKGSGEIVIQENAAVKSYGIEQQLHTKLSKTQQLSLIGYYNFNHREVQPSIASIGNGETLRNDDTRIIANYTNNSILGFWDVKLAYILNNELYNGNSRISTTHWSALLGWDKDISNKTAIRAGVNHHYFIPEKNNYVKNTKESRTELYASIKQLVIPGWEMSLNLRQSLYDETLAPFTPSFGQVYKVRFKISEIHFKNRIGRGYRIPTLNDRFWPQGGNPDLLPERSWNVEFGGQWIKKWSKTKLSVEGTYFYQHIDEWIQWTPNSSGIWQPENILQVEINGVEVAVGLKRMLGSHSILMKANYSYTQSLIKQDVTSTYINNQLPYVAKHAAHFKVDWVVKGWNNAVGVNFSGKRYIEKSNDEFQAIKGFTLLNYQVNKVFQVKKIKFGVGVEVKNILDIYYEQLKNHAMPGRNYGINLSINI